MERLGGRQANELRPVELTLDFTTFAEGSVLIKQGMTWVLCNATVLPGVPEWRQRQGVPGGWITAEYAMLPRSTLIRTSRETGGAGSRSQEIKRLIGRSLRAAVRLELLGNRTIVVDCDVLQADGGTRTASITGGYVALVSALRRLIQKEVIDEQLLRPAVAAISVGIVDGQPLLDLDYAEDTSAQTDMNVVMNRQREWIEVQASAEVEPFSDSQLQQMLSMAEDGILRLLEMQASALQAWQPQLARLARVE